MEPDPEQEKSPEDDTLKNDKSSGLFVKGEERPEKDKGTAVPALFPG